MTTEAKTNWLVALPRRAVDGYGALSRLLMRLEPVALLAMRLLVARVFLLSGLTKWDGLSIRQDAFDLFRYEYFERYNLPDPMIVMLAIIGAVAEIVLPILLALGLAGRIASGGLLVMALVIQAFVYPEEFWSVHAWWIACLFLLTTRGPGALSVDRVVGVEVGR